MTNWIFKRLTEVLFSKMFSKKGRPVLYNHRIQLSYRLPFENLPYLDFVNTEIGWCTVQLERSFYSDGRYQWNKIGELGTEYQ